MPKSTKIVLTVVIIIVVAGILWYVGVGKKAANAPGPNATSGLSTSDSDTSDAALQKDLTTVDAQMNGLSKDSASVDSSLNDKPVPQE